MEEFASLYSMGRILSICDHVKMPNAEQPCNYQQHFSLLARYINNAPLLISVWRNALAMVCQIQTISYSL